jgi:hypothetical protein
MFDRHRNEREVADVGPLPQTPILSILVVSRMTLTLPLGFLPHHVWQLAAAALAVLMVGVGLTCIIRGTAPGAERLGAQTVRLVGGVQVLLGIGVGLAGAFVNPEPACGGCGHGHWGGTIGIVGTVLWLSLLGAIAASLLRQSPRKR